MKRVRLPVLAMAVVAAAFASTTTPAALTEAQPSTTVVSGVVTDPLQGLVSGVDISLIDWEGKSRAKTRSGKDGRFTLRAVPDGQYRLQAVIIGFRTAREDVAVGGGMMTRDINLKLGGIEETVIVHASRRYENKPFEAARTRPDSGCEQEFKAGDRGGRVRTPIKIHHAWPQYPEGQKQARAEGQVLVNAVLGSDGLITKMRVTTSHEDFARAATTALAQWRFTPARLNCQPVALEATFQFAFTR